MSANKMTMPPKLKEIFDGLGSTIERVKAVTYGDIRHEDDDKSIYGLAEGIDLKTGKYLHRFINDMLAVYEALNIDDPKLAFNAITGCYFEDKRYPSVIPFYENTSAKMYRALGAIEGFPVFGERPVKPVDIFKTLKRDLSPFIK